jgi:hypothetical protein
MAYGDFTLEKVRKSFDLTIEENITAGLGQCGAKMVAAQIFNQREHNDNMPILGAVTSGNLWKFLELEDKLLKIDLNEYYLRDVSKILGILATGV